MSQRGVFAGIAVAGLVFAGARPAVASHACESSSETFVAVPLPSTPVAPERTALYIHDRGDEGLWIHVENGKEAGYQPGGVPLVIVFATAAGDEACRMVCNGDVCYKRPNSDDLLV